MPRAVIFDMDGVLVDSEPLHFRALSGVLARLGHQLTEAENQQFFGLTSAECWRILTARHALPGELDDYLAQYDEAVLRELRQPVAPTPGAPELVASLRREGVRLGLASASKCVWVDATLRAIGFTNAFDAMVCGDEVAHGKPSPDLFLLAASRLDIPPESCTVIEDSPNGLVAARRAGMRAVAVRTSSNEGLKLDAADEVIDSLVDWKPA